MSFDSVKQFVQWWYENTVEIVRMKYCHTFSTLRYQTPRFLFLRSYFANFISFKLGITITIGDHQMIFDFELRKVKLYQYVHCFTWTYQIERLWG